MEGCMVQLDVHTLTVEVIDHVATVLVLPLILNRQVVPRKILGFKSGIVWQRN